MSHTNSTSHYSLPQFVGTDIPTWLGDFNSAMTAIDSGIYAAATAASGAATDAAAAQKSANDAASDAAAAQKTANNALIAANRCPFPIGYGGFFQTDPNSIYADTTWEQKKDVFILASGNIYGAGSTGGEAQHTLTVEELPEHSHKANEWLLAVNKGGNPKQVNLGASSVSYSETSLVPITYSDEGTEAYPSSEAGGGKAHNNMPPYFAMPFWIRTA